jgi:lipid-A-disaccharide synthase
MFVILPFEKEFYQQFDQEVDYIGNPLLDSIAAFTPNPNFIDQNKLPKDKKLIAVLPGSRKQEIENMLKTMMNMVDRFPSYHFVVAGISDFPEETYWKYGKKANLSLVTNQTYDLLANAYAAVVTSGTATLETALFEVPQVVCYRTSFISALVVKMVLKVNFISLVNLIAGKEVVKELIQYNFTASTLDKELREITDNAKYYARIKSDYQSLKSLMGETGASESAAKKMVGYLKSSELS